jgi:predicted nucleotidyltransferase
MTSELPNLIQRMIPRLIRAFAPERILLFGSYAKGTNRETSDVDLLVITDMESSAAQHRRGRQLTSDCFPRVDIVFATPQEVAEAATARSPFLLSILGTGVGIYSRTDNEACSRTA